MRQITEVKRLKETFNLSPEEFKQGDWLKHIPKESDLFEVIYKNNYLTISSANIKKLSEMEG